MAEQIKVGDTVRIKSGGPLMTAVQVEEDQIQCMWHHRTKAGEWADDANVQWFPRAVLVQDDGLPAI